MAFGPDNADLRPSRNAIVELLRVRMHVWLANCPDFQVKRLDRKPTQCWEAPFRCSEERPSLKLGRFPTLKLENVLHHVYLSSFLRIRMRRSRDGQGPGFRASMIYAGQRPDGLEAGTLGWTSIGSTPRLRATVVPAALRTGPVRPVANSRSPWLREPNFFLATAADLLAPGRGSAMLDATTMRRWQAIVKTFQSTGRGS
jgi:hypothetical protein